MTVQLAGSQLILILSRQHPSASFQVAARASMDDALADWGSSSRCSPIFPINRSEWPKLGLRYRIWLAGPIFPGMVPTGVTAFLSLGIYNLVLLATTDEDTEKISAFLSKHSKTPWESWEVDGDGLIGRIEYSPTLEFSDNTKHDAGDFKFHPGLKSMTEEYRTLVAATVAKAKSYSPQIAQETLEFDRGFRSSIYSSTLKEINKSQWLVNVNAALSRFSSQAFAGISPVTGTECHYWTHSLLGVGTAVQALVSIRRQVQIAFDRTNFPLRLRELKKVGPNTIRLQKLAPSDGFWQHHHLPKLAENPARPQLPPIVCFSGRDGFRSTAHTLSVPLEVISSANTIGWSLRTVTHELSHVFVDAILGTLLPSLADEAVADRLVAILDSEDPSNMFEGLQVALCWNLCLIQQKDVKDSLEIKSGRHLVAIVQDAYPEVSEILTHIFDFQYFYQRNPTIYVASIWASWDVIPNIESRVREYLIRTLSAIMVLNLNVADPFGATVDRVLQELEALSAAMPGANIVKLAVQTLRTDRNRLRTEMLKIIRLVAICNGFFYSPELSAIVSRDVTQARSAPKRFPDNEFKDDVRVHNPLNFVYLQSPRSSGKSMLSNDPDPQKSAWIMAQLAFSDIREDDDE